MNDMSPLHFKENAIRALADPELQRALGNMRQGFIERRRKAASRLPEFDALRDKAREIKDHVIGHIDLYLEAFEKAVVANGGTVHWAKDSAQARDIVLNICRLVGALKVTKAWSMKIESGSKSSSLRPADWFVLRRSSSPEARRKPAST